MPQLSPNNTPQEARPVRTFQLAQAETQGAPTGETHTGTADEGHAGGHKPGDIPNASLLFANSVTVFIVLLLFAFAATRKFAAVPKGIANLGEWLAESMDKFTTGIIGPHGAKYTPLVGTTFVYIYLMNVIGLIPLFHAPTANISITLALGVVIFLYVQYQGIKTNGVAGHFKHFMGPMPALSPLLLPVELISEFVRPFTLAIRLFGNIFGEDVIIVVLAGLAGSLAGPALGWLPLQFPVLLLSLLTTLVQATVFAILTCVYLSLATSHDDDHAEGHGGAEGHHEPAHAH